jgi:hypothetical protein
MRDNDRPNRAREYAGARVDNAVAKALAANVEALVVLALLFDADDEGATPR